MTMCCRKSATITHFNGAQLSYSLVIFAQCTSTVIYETERGRKSAWDWEPELILNLYSLMRFGFADGGCSLLKIDEDAVVPCWIWQETAIAYVCSLCKCSLMLMFILNLLTHKIFNFFKRLIARRECYPVFEHSRFADTGQTWWVHAKVISPSIHLCQEISLGNSPKCGNSLGTDWCRRVKKAESECMCVLKWVCMCSRELIPRQTRGSFF